MNKDQKLLEEAYQSIYESAKEPLYFGPLKRKQELLNQLFNLKHEVYSDGSVSVEGDVLLRVLDLDRIPFKFRVVTGYFDCRHNKLASLKGAPNKVGGSFYCFANNLTSLEGAPEEVGRDFDCGHNNLTSLQGAPKEVEGHFYCGDNRLTSLEGAPKEVGGNFYCVVNSLSSLEGAPEVIGGEFDSDQFSDEDYREFVRKRKYVDGKLDKELDVDLDDFS